MLSFGEPIKHKVQYKNSEGKVCRAYLTCINANDATETLKKSPQLDFKEMISCEIDDNCDDCGLK